THHFNAIVEVLFTESVKSQLEVFGIIFDQQNFHFGWLHVVPPLRVTGHNDAVTSSYRSTTKLRGNSMRNKEGSDDLGERKVCRKSNACSSCFLLGIPERNCRPFPS